MLIQQVEPEVVTVEETPLSGMDMEAALEVVNNVMNLEQVMPNRRAVCALLAYTLQASRYTQALFRSEELYGPGTLSEPERINHAANVLESMLPSIRRRACDSSDGAVALKKLLIDLAESPEQIRKRQEREAADKALTAAFRKAKELCELL